MDKWCEGGRHHVHVMTIGVLKSSKTYLQLHRRHFTINSSSKHPEQVQETNTMSMMRSSMMRSSRINISRPLRPATCKSRMSSMINTVRASTDRISSRAQLCQQEEHGLDSRTSQPRHSIQRRQPRQRKPRVQQRQSIESHRCPYWIARHSQCPDTGQQPLRIGHSGQRRGQQYAGGFQARPQCSCV